MDLVPRRGIPHASMSADTPLPLQGVTVVDLTQIYNGPYATFLMAMAGADVIKVEPPGGEHLRKRNRSNGITQPFAVLNANKQSIVLNLRVADAREVLLKLAEKADVVVENFAPGVMDRLGLTEAVFRGRNPHLILASSSGYGTSGPYKAYPAMDLTVQAMSGVMAITGMADGPPLKAGPALCDFSAGIHLYGAIVTALYQRSVTGRAGTVEVSMMSTIQTITASVMSVPAFSGRRQQFLDLALRLASDRGWRHARLAHAHQHVPQLVAQGGARVRRRALRGQHHLHARPVADPDEAVLLEEAVGAGNGVEVDAEIGGQAANAGEQLLRLEGAGRNRFANLAGHLLVGGFVAASVDLGIGHGHGPMDHLARGGPMDHFAMASA